jgi:mono/diheme cytochrome c family protein
VNALRLIAVAATIVATLGLAHVELRAQEDYDFDKPPPAPLDPIDLGIKIYKELGNCQMCHGFDGTGGNQVMMEDGRFLDPAPPLTKSTMTTEEMIDIVTCGKLTDTNIMPSFHEQAWTPERPCWGKTEADIPAEKRPPPWGVPLYPDEIEAVVGWVQLALQGKEMSLEHCLRYYGPESRGCDRLKK